MGIACIICFFFIFFCLLYREMHQRSLRLQNPKQFNHLIRTNTYPKRLNIPQTIPCEQQQQNDDIYSTPQGVISPNNDETKYFTPKLLFQKQLSNLSTTSTDEYYTPDCTINNNNNINNNFIKLEKSKSTNIVQLRHPFKESRNHFDKQKDIVSRSQSEFLIPRQHSPQPQQHSFSQMFFKSDSLFSFLTPRPKRREIGTQSTPIHLTNNKQQYCLKSLPETRTTSLNSLEMGMNNNHIVKRYEIFKQNNVDIILGIFAFFFLFFLINI